MQHSILVIESLVIYCYIQQLSLGFSKSPSSKEKSYSYLKNMHMPKQELFFPYARHSEDHLIQYLKALTRLNFVRIWSRS